MKLLHIDTSILGDGSVSRKLSAAIVNRLRRAHPGIEVSYRDLATTPLPHITTADLAGPNPVLDEFLAADTVVIGAPMYNFTVPSQLKAWIDRIVIAGQTFRYTETGVEGLAAGKRVIAAVSRGGLYGAESPAAAMEHVETYLRSVFAFIGVANPEIIVAEGIMVAPELRDKAVNEALQTVANLAVAQAA